MTLLIKVNKKCKYNVAFMNVSSKVIISEVFIGIVVMSKSNSFWYKYYDTKASM
jgi:hypothetical protein